MARRLATATLLSITLLSAAVAYALVCAGSPDRGPAVPTLPPSRVLTQAPYVGVACRVPNWIGCDRVGLSVSLGRPALGVRATIAGRPLRLDNPTWSGPLRRGRRKRFAGFLQPAGLTSALHVRPDAGPSTWLGSDAPTPEVRIWIDYGGRKVVTTRVAVSVEAGWG